MTATVSVWCSDCEGVVRSVSVVLPVTARSQNSKESGVRISTSKSVRYPVVSKKDTSLLFSRMQAVMSSSETGKQGEEEVSKDEEDPCLDDAREDEEEDKFITDDDDEVSLSRELLSDVSVLRRSLDMEVSGSGVVTDFNVVEDEVFSTKGSWGSNRRVVERASLVTLVATGGSSLATLLPLPLLKASASRQRVTGSEVEVCAACSNASLASFFRKRFLAFFPFFFNRCASSASSCSSSCCNNVFST